MRNLIDYTVAAVVAVVAVGTAQAAEMKTVAISTIVEVPALLETKQGILEALAERGYIEGKTIVVDYQNANGNMPTQRQIAKKFIGSNPDVIIPITTPTSQAMVANTKTLPIVFATVTDPVKARLISRYKQPGANVTGVSDAAPIGQQLDLFKEIVPGLKKIGFVYNPGLDNALATLGWMKEQGATRGIEVVESPAPTTNEVLLATRKLIGEVDAIYIPNDTTVVGALESIVKIGWGVDLTVPNGEFLTVIDSNGAGKSTALNVMAGVARPETGEVRVANEDMTLWPVHRRARSISRVFQDPKTGTCEDLTILENFSLAYGRTAPRGLRFATDRAMRDAVAERLKVLDLGLETRLDDKVGLLSGGQRQGISLLMAATGSTQVLLLDEHTAALDPKTGGFVLDLTKQIVAELKLTAVMVTHSMAQALDTGDRTIMFHRGKIVFDVSGAERDGLEVEDLLRLFRETQGEELSDDSLLLG